VNIRKFKYAGSDDGFLYTYFYNPLATKMVEKTPEWLAPNTITLAGFSFSFIPFIVFFLVFGTHYYNEDPTKAKIPRWVFFLEGIFYFLYRMLDEMDGK